MGYSPVYVMECIMIITSHLQSSEGMHTSILLGFAMKLSGHFLKRVRPLLPSLLLFCWRIRQCCDVLFSRRFATTVLWPTII
jgi:hypothetical protein